MCARNGEIVKFLSKKYEFIDFACDINYYMNQLNDKPATVILTGSSKNIYRR